MILSLVFVPLRHIHTYIDVLSADLPDELRVLLNWFEDNYIGRLYRHGTSRRPSLFPLEM